MAEGSATQLRAALARADRPLRARALARDLGLHRADVTAQLRRLQDSGDALSRDRRWVAVESGTAAPVDGDQPSTDSWRSTARGSAAA
jgi:biotin operon repressor